MTAVMLTTHPWMSTPSVRFTPWRPSVSAVRLRSQLSLETLVAPAPTLAPCWTSPMFGLNPEARLQVCPVFEASMSRNAIDAPAFDDATPYARLRYFPAGILPSRVPHRARTLSEPGLDL